MIQGVDDRIRWVAFTIGEAAHSLGISASSVRRQIRTGQITVLRIGGLVRVPAWALDEYTHRAVHSKLSA
jgi:excisionase family DNA binding protein